MHMTTLEEENLILEALYYVDTEKYTKGLSLCQYQLAEVDCICAEMGLFCKNDKERLKLANDKLNTVIKFLSNDKLIQCIINTYAVRVARAFAQYVPSE
jgi:hypothetical protein